MKEVKIKAKVEHISISKSKIIFEFGRTQGSLWISGTGVAARKLKLKTGDKIEVTIKSLGK